MKTSRASTRSSNSAIGTPPISCSTWATPSTPWRVKISSFQNGWTPSCAPSDSATPLVYARGNHDTRGPFARELSSYVPIEEGRFYYARDAGPIHLVAVDTGEDKPDTTNVYAHLNDFAPYRDRELAWLEDHTRTSKRMAEAPFRIVAMHQPMWGAVQGGNERWTDWANRSKVDLVIAGHTHRFAHIQPGQRGNNYPILIVGQDQLAKVEATATQLKASVLAKDGSVVESFVIERGATHTK